MFFRHIFLLVALACITRNEAFEATKSSVIDKEILQKFLNVVKANQLNVSIVTSKGQYWTNGQLQELWDVALQLPVNHVHLTESKLTPQVGKEWISDMHTMSGAGEGIGTYRVVGMQNGEHVQHMIQSSNQEAIPHSPSYDTIIGMTHEHVGSSLHNPKHEFIYKFLMPGEDEPNETVKIVAASLNITVVDKSSSMSVVEVEAIMKILPKIWWMYDHYTLMADGLVEILGKKFPQTHWQVIIGADKYYLDSDKYITLSVANVKVTIFAIHSP